MKILTVLILFISLLMALNVFANTNDLINQQIQHRDQITKSYQGKFENLKASSLQGTANYQPIIEKLKKTAINNLGQGAVQKSPNAVIFVSFSMPDLALKQLIEEGKKYQIPIVMRGLYKNSFQETAAKIFNLVKEKNQGGIAIDPLWFKEFNIQTVPAFVIKHGNDFDVVYGNIFLKRALEIIAENGVSAKEAKDILTLKT